MLCRYINLKEALLTHKLTIEKSGGGNSGVLNDGQLDSILENIQNDDWYPTFEEKLTHLIFSVCKCHCFADGNKRIAIVLGFEFLLINGYYFAMTNFLEDMENISYHVAAGNIDKDLLGRIISARLSGKEDDESLKLDIINATTDKVG
ncbi:MAG TPA: type II toxin-antitoxin system death-on-curing family toxin [Candidatus Cloacimonadota bacterium]|nr:type II toxin-antitoxin system death-on-curing family toxin [Candidatus Cloacimonadota bacterium]HQL15567.1 type II toxin-antitoxin system death-on-curing family toxin [Candidatus Cloacimonadota bacterium]